VSHRARRCTLAALATALATGGAALAGCGAQSQQELERANAAVMAKVNAYCDGRQKAIEALGEAGAGQ